MAFTVQKRELTLENPFLYWKGFLVDLLSLGREFFLLNNNYNIILFHDHEAGVNEFTNVIKKSPVNHANHLFSFRFYPINATALSCSFFPPFSVRSS